MILYDFYDQRKYSIFGVKSSFPIMHIFLQIFFLIIKYQAKKGETLRITYQGGRKYHNLPQVMPLKSWTSIYIEVRDGIHTLLGLIVGGRSFSRFMDFNVLLLLFLQAYRLGFLQRELFFT